MNSIGNEVMSFLILIAGGAWFTDLLLVMLIAMFFLWVFSMSET